ncbi:hypothetical protein MNV_1270015 [Candidatus Methanoperedens nitroreducens]|uniref:Uncharacterized protein n=1 Tax=Candidatus Methanoperedens nitratireducens TaxID=1392998 RepID=A0A284VK86_9EURY|nr:hypothetical protein MNV_1270015 [Candidatus Methanoperedens nitroreducens]
MNLKRLGTHVVSRLKASHAKVNKTLLSFFNSVVTCMALRETGERHHDDMLYSHFK